MNCFRVQLRSFSIRHFKRSSDNISKLLDLKQSTKKCSIKSVAELGQPTFWTHRHLFDNPNEKDLLKQEVTPGITKQEYEKRRDDYVNSLTNYQMFYFSSRISKMEKSLLERNSVSDWLLNGYDNTTIDNNFIAVIPSAMTSFMAPDVPYQFRQNSDFLYLTGFKEPNSVLVISKTNEQKYKTALFCREKNPKTELWEGPNTGPINVNRLCGIDNAYSISELKTYLQSLVKEVSFNKKVTFWRYPIHELLSESGPNCINNSIENDIEEFLKEAKTTTTKLIDMNDQDPVDSSASASYFNSSRYFVQLNRVKKSQAELNIMKKACDISSEAFINTMKLSHPYINEHLIQTKFEYDCKIREADYLAYIPVIAGGPRATVLHYIRNNQIVNHDSMLLMDAGCQYRDYVSDISRTWPVNGRFNSAQRDLYNACLNVQLHCLQHCKAGTTLQRLYNIMMKKLSEELANLGLIDKKDHDVAMKLSGNDDERLPMYHLKKLSNFCPHDIGHYLGMDVHDCPEISKSIKLEENCVITIEPGIYIRQDDETVPFKYRGIGIRIEDDVVIKNDSCEVLNRNLPKSVEDIERILING